MKLIDKLPYFYDNGYTRPIIEAEQIESDILVEEIAETLKQCFVSTATWGLDYWEDMLFLPRGTGKSYTERRSIIYTRMRATRTTTVEVVKELASAFFNTENVTVIEENENYMFHIEFENAYPEFRDNSINTNIAGKALVGYAKIGTEKIGTEKIVINLKNVENIIDIYKPAHLNYSFTFTLKDKIQIESNQKSGHSILPICNTFKVGTWWKMYADGSSNKGKVIQAKSYDGYSYLPICGLYKNMIKMSKEEFELINSPDISSRIGGFKIGYSKIL